MEDKRLTLDTSEFTEREKIRMAQLLLCYFPWLGTAPENPLRWEDNTIEDLERLYKDINGETHL